MRHLARLLQQQRVFRVVDAWRRPHGWRRLAAIGLVIVLVVAIGTLVYQTGGTKLVYAHLLYVPIITAAFFFGLGGALVTAVTAGILAGPFMPLDVDAGLAQSTGNWVVRAGLFVLVGFLVGMVAEILDAQLTTISSQGYYDPESGLPNLVLLREHVERMLSSEQGAVRSITLHIVKLRDHAEITAALGYDAGVRLTAQMAERLRENHGLDLGLYQIDRAGLALLAKEVDPDEAIEAAQRITGLFDRPFHLNAAPVHLSGVVGVANHPAHAKSAAGLLRAASSAVQSAELSGSDYAVYDRQVDASRRNSLRMLNELHDAIDGDQLEFYYQPQVELPSGRVAAVEALLRWHHPDRGMLTPGAFIAEAERTGFVRTISDWALRHAVVRAAQWQNDGVRLNVAVNLSAHDLQDENLPRRIEMLLRRHNAAPERLKIEVTESSVLVDRLLSQRILKSVRDLGVMVAIDDFGTGQSSLAYLKDLPADYLKIDQSFVGQMLSDQRMEHLVATVIDLGHNLSMRLVAEGVETEAAYRRLAEMGCDFAQGYYIARPMPADQLQHWMAVSGNGAFIPGRA